MAYYIVKILITVLLVVTISELSNRNSFLGALLASVPLVSVLAMIWLYVDTGDVAKVSELASSVFWLVLPSLALFIALPLMLSQGVNFYLSLTISIVITVICYGLLVVILRFYGIEL
ncbi:DUF3147 family protein [Pseudohongiella sp.]|uniref:DUF3147 family protein n=1 Tax=marine sediment metagenome TaxID=412755 RepID=A0A0F9W5V0_9ZZZZ|nr:DUF3147 family protein [Pseudohongiella sp.]HDZ09641.1 DUF3147 family protein [Pseudohongiella sp.]HEA61830.1 DUF3147 family protein [Pseudohongiella sp.]